MSTQRLYTEETSGLPRRLSVFSSDSAGDWIEQQRIDYSEWLIDPILADSVFDITPPEDARAEAPQ